MKGSRDSSGGKLRSKPVGFVGVLAVVSKYWGQNLRFYDNRVNFYLRILRQHLALSHTTKKVKNIVRTTRHTVLYRLCRSVCYEGRNRSSSYVGPLLNRPQLHYTGNSVSRHLSLYSYQYMKCPYSYITYAYPYLTCSYSKVTCSYPI